MVFGSIVNEGYLNSSSESEEFCIYNRNPNACGYGVTVGVLAFLTCLLYLALDVYFPQISSVKDRKKAVLSDIGVSGEPHLSGHCTPPPPAAQSLQGAVPAVVLLSLTHSWEVAATLCPFSRWGN